MQTRYAQELQSSSASIPSTNNLINKYKGLSHLGVTEKNGVNIDK